MLGCDEKSQCQALERTRRPLPLRKGYGRTQTHDCIRHGTITLFAALSYLEGKKEDRGASYHVCLLDSVSHFHSYFLYDPIRMNVIITYI